MSLWLSVAKYYGSIFNTSGLSFKVGSIYFDATTQRIYKTDRSGEALSTYRTIESLVQDLQKQEHLQMTIPVLIHCAMSNDVPQDDIIAEVMTSISGLSRDDAFEVVSNVVNCFGGEPPSPGEDYNAEAVMKQIRPSRIPLRLSDIAEVV